MIDAKLINSDDPLIIKFTLGGRNNRESGKQTFDKAAILASLPDGALKTHLNNLSDANWAKTLKLRFSPTMSLQNPGHVGVEYLSGAIEVEYRSWEKGDPSKDTATLELEFVPED